MQLLSSIIFLMSLVTIANSIKCLNFGNDFRKFRLLRNYQRSVQLIVAWDSVDSLGGCAAFTKSNRGLAFNFASKESIGRHVFENNNNNEKSGNSTTFQRKLTRKHLLDQPEEFYNCHALSCPEVGNLTTLVNDSRYDYYTMYSHPIPPSNAICIPEVGLFQFYNTPTNYSSAYEACSLQSGGALAHILSETRTNRISSFLRTKIQQEGHIPRVAYVGLNRTFSDSEFYTSDGESLQCFLYRAWAPGQPSDHLNQSCVAITVKNSWLTNDCTRKLPFICEIYATGIR